MNRTANLAAVPAAGRASPPADALGRPLKSLRVSLVDMCNLRCNYCMPEEEYAWLPREDILSAEEIGRLVDTFTDLGVEKVRLTGGEPLMRRDVTQVVERLATNPRITDLSLTTNAALLAKYAEPLRRAGLHRLTVSLDTLKRERFIRLTRRDQLENAITGIDAARMAGFQRLKINTVVIRGHNDDELGDLIEFAREMGAEVRFIEYMDVGGATRWSMDRVFTGADMLQAIERRYGSPRPLGGNGSAPAHRYALPDGATFGIIASTTAPFCAACDRSRITADGLWFLCLYAAGGVDLRTPLRNGSSQDEIHDLVAATWAARANRGAEQRQALNHRGPLYQIEDLRKDPHREMHTRGG